MKFRVFLLLALTIFTFNCKHNSFSTEKELVDFILDDSNGYTKRQTINGVEFNLTFRPTDLLVSQEIRNEEVTEQKLLELKNKYNKYLYFHLGISKGGREILSVIPNNKLEYSNLSNKLLFEIGDKVHLITKNKDTLKFIDYIYPRMYGASHSTDLMFVFSKDEKINNSEVLNFTIQDIEIGTGQIEFKFDKEIIKNQPTIVFK